MEARRSFLTKSQFRLKKAGPKPSGPRLALLFMEKRAARISSRVKGVISEAAWKESREVEATRGASSKVLEAGWGVPRRSLKKEWRMAVFAG
jgi:hypothetical protein